MKSAVWRHQLAAAKRSEKRRRKAKMISHIGNVSAWRKRNGVAYRVKRKGNGETAIAAKNSSAKREMAAARHLGERRKRQLMAAKKIESENGNGESNNGNQQLAAKQPRVISAQYKQCGSGIIETPSRRYRASAPASRWQASLQRRRAQKRGAHINSNQRAGAQRRAKTAASNNRGEWRRDNDQKKSMKGEENPADINQEEGTLRARALARWRRGGGISSAPVSLPLESA